MLPTNDIQIIEEVLPAFPSVDCYIVRREAVMEEVVEELVTHGPVRIPILYEEVAHLCHSHLFVTYGIVLVFRSTSFQLICVLTLFIHYSAFSALKVM